MKSETENDNIQIQFRVQRPASLTCYLLAFLNVIRSHSLISVEVGETLRI